MGTNALPDGWESASLGDNRHFQLIMGQSPPGDTYNDQGKGLPFFQGKADFGEMHPTPRIFCLAPSRISQKDDVLISVRAPVGPTNLADRECAIGRGLAAVRCKAGISPRYLLSVLRCLEAQLAHLAEGQGGGFTCLRKQQLAAFNVPIPPLPEQRRLVGRIEALTSRVEQARQGRRAAVAETDVLLTATIARLFSKSDCWKNVRAAVSQKKGAVRNGPFGSQLLHHEFTTAGVAAIGTRDVQTNRFDLQSGWFVSTAKFEQFRRYQIFPNDVLCTIVGASIGRFCVVPEDVPLAFTTKHIQALTLNPDAAIPSFVSFMLNFHPRCRKSLFSQVDGSAQPSLNATKVLTTELPLPSVNEQRRIVARLDALAAKQAALRLLQSETESELVALTPAFLAKAFRGQV